MMNIKFRNKTALILSGSKGIGFGIAKNLQDSGCKVIISSSSKKNLLHAKKKLNNRCTTINLDIHSDRSVSTFIKKVLKIKIDILILNAPGPKSIPLKTCKINDFKLSINYLLINMIKISESLLINMIKQKYGRLVNISSLTAIEPEANMALSNIPRAGLLSYMKTASKEYSKNNITFNSILTGGVLTDRANEMIALDAKRNNKTFKETLTMAEKSIPTGYIPDADEFSNLITFLCSDKSGSINGASIPVDGGFKNSI